MYISIPQFHAHVCRLVQNRIDLCNTETIYAYLWDAHWQKYKATQLCIVWCVYTSQRYENLYIRIVYLLYTSTIHPTHDHRGTEGIFFNLKKWNILYKFHSYGAMTDMLTQKTLAIFIPCRKTAPHHTHKRGVNVGMDSKHFVSHWMQVVCVSWSSRWWRSGLIRLRLFWVARTTSRVRQDDDF